MIKAVLMVAFLMSTALADEKPVKLELSNAPTKWVIDENHPDAKGNFYGFEGGTALKVNGMYHLFMSEMIAPPLWGRMKFGHWTSTDGVTFKRLGDVTDLHGANTPPEKTDNLWSPMVVWDPASNRWNLFFVHYRWNRPGEPGGQFDGTIYRSESTVKGRDGIGSPYRDLGVVLRPSKDSDKWEGQQGTDSFYPFQVNDKWLAFYGSHNHGPRSGWMVGLAQSKELGGPWKRMTELNPSPIEKRFTENPVVLRDDDGTYLAVYDSDDTVDDDNYHEDGQTIGYAWSHDGIHWNPGVHLTILPKGEAWDIRTPLGLVPEGNGKFTIYFTARRWRDKEYFQVGMVNVNRVQ